MTMMVGVLLLASCGKDGTDVVEKSDQSIVESRSVYCDENAYCTTILTPKFHKHSVFIKGCEVKVEYWTNECWDPVRLQTIVKFYGLKLKVQNSPACNALLPILQAGQEIEYNNLLNALYKQVLDKIEIDFFNSLHPSGTKYAVQWIETSCFMYCIKVINEDEGIQWFDIISVKCGISCCKRVTPWTRGPGDIWIRGTTTVTGDPICSSMPVPETCTGLGTSVGICNVACSRL